MLLERILHKNTL